MQYDFNTPVDRRDTDSLKWDVMPGELPMWVADMDFMTAPEVSAAIQARAAHSVYGYSIVPGEWNRAYRDWWQRRHQFEMEEEWLVFCTGVVPAISSCVRKLTTPGENIVVQTPVYNIFFNSIRNNGRNVLKSPLLLKDGSYEMDFVDLEKKLSDPQTTLMLLCNPQNPSGKIWEKDALCRVGELCKQHHVTVISDEIHCDLTEPGAEYVPFAAASETCRQISITCLSPSKAFNLAGLQSAAVMIPDEVLRHKVWRALNTDEVAEPNAFAVTACVAAYEKGGEWLDALRGYLADNRKMAGSFLEEHIPDLQLVRGRATYLLWIDARGVIALGKNLAQFIRKKTGLYLSDGSEYGADGFLRMNIACQKAVLEDGLCRLETGVRLYREAVDSERAD